MFNFFNKIRQTFFSLREILFIFVLFKTNNILNNKNLGNKQIVFQEETFSQLREIDFYTIILFLLFLKLRQTFFSLSFSYERIFFNTSICFNLRETLFNKCFSYFKHFSKTNLVFENKFCL